MSDRLTTEYADLVNIYNKEQNFIRQNDSILPVIHIAWLYNKNVEIIDAPASEYKLPEVINTHFDELFSSYQTSEVYDNMNIRVDDWKLNSEKNLFQIFSGRTTYYKSLVTNRAMDYVLSNGATASLKIISDTVSKLYDRIIDKKLLVRRITLSVGKVHSKQDVEYQQLNLFTDYAVLKKEQEKEKKLQESLLSIKKKYGKNAILRGINYEEGATTIERNEQIGGHKA